MGTASVSFYFGRPEQKSHLKVTVWLAMRPVWDETETNGYEPDLKQGLAPGLAPDLHLNCIRFHFLIAK
jgi:hypothetical protein